MPPKKKTTKAKAEPEAAEESAAQTSKDETKDQASEPPASKIDDAPHDSKADASEDAQPEDKPTEQAKPAKKRKKATGPTEPSQASRKSARGAPRPSQQQLLNFLLSEKAEELVRPEDEKQALKENAKLKTYSSTVLNPFEELMSAVILSRPISHRLGLRSIRTVLSDPYNFNSAKAVQSAGEEKRHQALWDARTQHKGKTADQLGNVADVVLDKFTSSGDKEGTQLKKLLSDNDDDVDQALDVLEKGIKGLGKTGIDIFLRRVQWLWKQSYPFVDGRTMDALRKIGLSQDGEELEKALNEHWKKLDTKHLAGEDEAARKRRAFVIILERSIGADLENKLDELFEAAASA